MFGETADGFLKCRINTDQFDFLSDVSAINREPHEGEEFDRRGHGGDVRAGRRPFDSIHHVFGGHREALEHIERFDHDVRRQPMQPILQLRAESAHDAVHDNQRRRAEHHAYDTDHRQVARPQVAPPKEEFVHRSLDEISTVYVSRSRGAARTRNVNGYLFSGRNNGNKITSPIACVSVSSMHSRSMPMPSPPAGGIAWRSARTKSS